LARCYRHEPFHAAPGWIPGSAYNTVDVNGTLVHMGELALAAGVCTVAAGIWNSRKGQILAFGAAMALPFSALGLLFTLLGEQTNRLSYYRAPDRP